MRIWVKEKELDNLSSKRYFYSDFVKIEKKNALIQKSTVIWVLLCLVSAYIYIVDFNKAVKTQYNFWMGGVKVLVNLNSIDKVKKFVRMMSNIEDNIDLVSGRYIVDAKSLLGIFSLDLAKPIKLEFNGSKNEESISKKLEEFEIKSQA